MVVYEREATPQSGDDWGLWPIEDEPNAICSGTCIFFPGP